MTDEPDESWWRAVAEAADTTPATPELTRRRILKAAHRAADARRPALRRWAAPALAACLVAGVALGVARHFADQPRQGEVIAADAGPAPVAPAAPRDQTLALAFAPGQADLTERMRSDLAAAASQTDLCTANLHLAAHDTGALTQTRARAIASGLAQVLGNRCRPSAPISRDQTAAPDTITLTIAHRA